MCKCVFVCVVSVWWGMQVFCHDPQAQNIKKISTLSTHYLKFYLADKYPQTIWKNSFILDLYCPPPPHPGSFSQPPSSKNSKHLNMSRSASGLMKCCVSLGIPLVSLNNHYISSHACVCSGGRGRWYLSQKHTITYRGGVVSLKAYIRIFIILRIFFSFLLLNIHVI